MVTAALNGELENVPYTAQPVSKVWVPAAVSGVPAAILNPRTTWKDPVAYGQQAQELARQFGENFKPFAAAGQKLWRQAQWSVEVAFAI